MNSILNLLQKKERIFIVPIDHPEGEDTKKLSKMGIQNFVNKIDSCKHDGYIFHSRDYTKNSIKTKKNFFLTVGEQPENYKLPLNELEKLKGIKNLTIFFEVDKDNDEKPVEFYKEYVKKLKDKGYIVMGMGYPSKLYNNPNYQLIADIAFRIGCDFFKTDFFIGIDKLNLQGMKIFIAGGKFMEQKQFENFVKEVEKLKIASASFGRNIFESDNFIERINFVINTFK
jgi:hypothetical protein